MKVYIVTSDDNFPSESSSEILGVYNSLDKAIKHLKRDYDDMIASCKEGHFIPEYFKEYTTESTTKYWEIRSKTDEYIYMSETIDEQEVL